MRTDEESDHLGNEVDVEALGDSGDKQSTSESKGKLVMRPAVGDNNGIRHTSLKSTGSKRAREADDEQGEASILPSYKKKKVIGIATAPTAVKLKYSMEHYELYDPTAKNVGVHWETAHKHLRNYDSYTLFMIPTCQTAGSVPDRGVRLDDLNVALVGAEYGRKKLLNAWRAEFDKEGMVRSSRVPMGHAAKVFRREGDRDLDRYVLNKDEEGWYYQWYEGLQLLCGKEGLDAGLYKHRPSFEDKHPEGTGFKRGYKAVVQLPPGHRDDPTFKGFPEYVMLPVKKEGETL